MVGHEWSDRGVGHEWSDTSGRTEKDNSVGHKWSDRGNPIVVGHEWSDRGRNDLLTIHEKGKLIYAISAMFDCFFRIYIYIYI